MIRVELPKITLHLLLFCKCRFVDVSCSCRSSSIVLFVFWFFMIFSQETFLIVLFVKLLLLWICDHQGWTKLTRLISRETIRYLRGLFYPDQPHVVAKTVRWISSAVLTGYRIRSRTASQWPPEQGYAGLIIYSWFQLMWVSTLTFNNKSMTTLKYKQIHANNIYVGFKTLSITELPTFEVLLLVPQTLPCLARLNQQYSQI